MLRSLVLVSALALPVARAQDTAPEHPMAAVVESVMKEARTAKDADSFQAVAKKAIEEHKAELATGDGVHYRGVLLSMSGDVDGAIVAHLAYADAAPGSTLATRSLLIAAQLTNGGKDDPKAAQKILERVDAETLTGADKGMYAQTKSMIEVDLKRSELNGQPAPDFAATHVLNGPATWKLSDLRGKVVLIDFFATWCPPCRAVVPELVKLQKEMAGDDVQVVCATRFFGYGMDFSDPAAELPHGGKKVGNSRKDADPPQLTEDEELKVNEAFIKAFDVNYPVVFVDAKVSRTDYGVSGIPTVFVIGKDGNIVGSVVGSGQHDALMKLVDKAKGAADTHGS